MVREMKEGLVYDEPMAKQLTHQDEHGRAGMVSVSDKPVMRRRAVACGEYCAAPGTIELVMEGK